MNPYRKFLNRLEVKKDDEGYQVIEPEILIIGNPEHPLVVPRPYRPDQIAEWEAKYNDPVLLAQLKADRDAFFESLNINY